MWHALHFLNFYIVILTKWICLATRVCTD